MSTGNLTLALPPVQLISVFMCVNWALISQSKHSKDIQYVQIEKAGRGVCCIGLESIAT